MKIGLDQHVVSNRPPHIVDDVTLQFLEGNVFQNVIKLVQRFEHRVLLTGKHGIIFDQGMASWSY